MQTTDDLSKPVRLGALSMAKVTRALLDGPCSIRELQVISGLSTNTLHEYMRALRKEQVVHICAWEKDATGRVPSERPVTPRVFPSKALCSPSVSSCIAR
jgi:hypothetical protein